MEAGSRELPALLLSVQADLLTWLVADSNFNLPMLAFEQKQLGLGSGLVVLGWEGF